MLEKIKTLCKKINFPRDIKRFIETKLQIIQKQQNENLSLNRLFFQLNHTASKKINKNLFLLFNYCSHKNLIPVNLGDYIQTIATKNALESLFDTQYEFVDRDKLNFFSHIKENDGGGGCNLYNARMVFSFV